MLILFCCYRQYNYATDQVQLCKDILTTFYFYPQTKYVKQIFEMAVIVSTPKVRVTRRLRNDKIIYMIVIMCQNCLWFGIEPTQLSLSLILSMWIVSLNWYILESIQSEKLGALQEEWRFKGRPFEEEGCPCKKGCPCEEEERSSRRPKGTWISGGLVRHVGYKHWYAWVQIAFGKDTPWKYIRSLFRGKRKRGIFIHV